MGYFENGNFRIISYTIHPKLFSFKSMSLQNFIWHDKWIVHELMLCVCKKKIEIWAITNGLHGVK